MLDSIVLDLAFLGANGVSIEHGMTVPDTAIAAVKSAAVRNSRRRIFVGDSTKFGTDSFARFAAVSDFERIVTDAALPVDYAAELHSRGVELTRA
jgi:DeoR/GlpR family transcriptional regulator of sugar metabolism